MRNLLRYLGVGKSEQDDSGSKVITAADRVRSADERAQALEQKSKAAERSPAVPTHSIEEPPTPRPEHGENSSEESSTASITTVLNVARGYVVFAGALTLIAHLRFGFDIAASLASVSAVLAGILGRVTHRGVGTKYLVALFCAAGVLGVAIGVLDFRWFLKLPFVAALLVIGFSSMVSSIQPKKPLRLYSVHQVNGAAFFGGSIAGGWLLALNFVRTENPKAALVAMLAAVVVMVPLVALLLLLPSDLPYLVIVLALLNAQLFAAGYRKTFAAKYSEHIGSGASKAPFWKAAGITVATLPVYAISTFAFTTTIPITAMNELRIYDNAIYYEGRATRPDAEQLGEFLTNQDLLYDGSYLLITIEFPKDLIEEVIIKADIERPTEESETYLAILQLLQAAEQELYPGKQVSFEVVGFFGNTIMQITAN